ncbi:O-antigen ligase family protein [Thiohalophilus sp.]|uniref:O-antigen ligase family protein n=1 Tax=Thiohalophilus sp. TaxID=3028392 RepID=UPI002ACDAF35|nr:O-antigen ligase family protein [Thiohalophilus sp.]MDZ7804689.1 O-antigen ligase family protein [Thiohalophilus sp.]
MMLSARLAPLARYFPLEPMSLIRLWVLLFPIGVIYVEHWASTFFGLLILTSLILWPMNRASAPKLHHEEKVLLWILGAYFIVAILSITANGWDDAGQKALGNELKFLLIIPFYLVARRCEELWRYLWIGSWLAIVVTVAFGLHELYVLDRPRAVGPYSPLLLGPVLLLMVVLQLPWHRYLARYHWRNAISLLIALAGFYIVVMSGARNAYVALLVMSLIAFGYYFRARNSLLIIIATCILMVVSYSQVDLAKHRVDQAVNDVSNYVGYMIEDPVGPNKHANSSAGKRMEMWRASVFAAAEQPLLGIGRYNLHDKLKQFAKEGRIHKAATHHAHPHSVYFEALASKGILGLAAVLVLYLYPLYFFIRTRQASRESAFTGILLLTAIMVFSIADSAPVFHNNYTAVFLTYLAVIFAWHSHQIHKTNKTESVSTT